MTTLVIDNALENPEQVRNAVLEYDFSEQTGPDGAQYKHICLQAQPISEVQSILEKAFVDKKIKWGLTFWRQDWEGELPHSFCHADKICAEYAVLWYGMPADLCIGGTAFWSHVGLGFDHLPSDSELRASGILPHRFHPWMTEQTKHPELWELRGLVAMAPNRLVVYPTKLWHSRLPAEGSGTCQEDGRMLWVGFFNVE
jgi:hypothetical protein